MIKDTILETLPEDQWFIESQELRSLVVKVRKITAKAAENHTQIAKLEPCFQELFAQQQWLPEKFAQVNPESKMGGGIGQTNSQLSIRNSQLNQWGYQATTDIRPLKSKISVGACTSESESVSIHLLGNDTGCIWRHQFIPESHSVKSFRSGYANAPCKQEEEK